MLAHVAVVHATQSRSKLPASLRPSAALVSARPFAAVRTRLPGQGDSSCRGGSRSSSGGGSTCAPGRRRFVVQNWGALKALGLTKPSWLPDFGQAKRKAILDRFFASPILRDTMEELLDDHFRMAEQLRNGAGQSRTYFKSDFIELMCNYVAPAIPNFTWSAATDGKADKDGYAIVAVKVSGHHTGSPFALPGLEPVPPTGRRVTLEQELMKVRVEAGRIKEIVVLPSYGAGPLALYKALGGGKLADTVWQEQV